MPEGEVTVTDTETGETRPLTLPPELQKWHEDQCNRAERYAGYLHYYVQKRARMGDQEALDILNQFGLQA